MLLRTLIFVAVSSTCALAADIVVPPGGSIQAAIDSASNGDRILIQPGTYHESIDLRGKLIIVEGVGGAAQTVIDATGLNDSVVVAVSGEPDGTRLIGLTVSGGQGRFLPTVGPNVYGGGVLAMGAATRLNIVSCVIAGNGGPSTAFGGGLYCAHGARVSLVNCIVRDNQVWYVANAAYADRDAAELSFERCTVYSNHSPFSGALVYNEAHLVVNSCILWANDGPEIFGYLGPLASASVTFSDVDRGWVWTGVGNINQDPQFLSLADLTLNPASPCIDAGDPTLGHDLDGTRADMGGVAFNHDTPTNPYCFGDGTSASCPCGTSAGGNGCPNSISPNGARLTSTGYAGVTYDTFELVASDVPNGPGLYFQATGATDIPNFGDGKFCAGVGVTRLGVTFAASNSSSYPDAVLTTPIHSAGAIPTGGGTRYYQAWYRDTDPTFCTPSLFNLTNGLSVAWVP